MEHFVECASHPRSYHVKHGTCIKCTAALKRREREAQHNTKEHDKENQQPDGNDAHDTLNNCAKKKKKQKKKTKKTTCSAGNPKSQKQLRREAKAARKSLATTCTDEGNTDMPEEDICKK